MNEAVKQETDTGAIALEFHRAYSEFSAAAERVNNYLAETQRIVDERNAEFTKLKAIADEKSKIADAIDARLKELVK